MKKEGLNKKPHGFGWDFDFGGGVSALEIADFTKHLSVMVKAGISLNEALETLASKTATSKLKKILEGIEADLANGATLTFAMQKYPQVFDQFYISIIAVSEQSGTLDSNLEYLSDKLHKQLTLRHKIKEALFYPSIVISAAFIVGFGISIFILPKMSDLFRSFDLELPWATRVLLYFSDFMKKYNVSVLIAVVIITVVFRLLLTNRHFRSLWIGFLLQLPVIGQFLITVETASLCRNLGVMLRSGLPITTALEIAAKTTENPLYKKYVKILGQAVSEGLSISEQLYANKCPRIPAMATKMINVGEKSGRLVDMLLYLGEYYEEETDNQAKNFSTILEPILLLLIGGVVLIVAMAIITPIYQLTGSIK